MKIQYLAVIFVIIILPISLILSAYTQNHISTLNLQELYGSKLDTATYDAVKAFQLNTINNSTSDIQNSKIRDIEAAVNTFFNSIASNFNMVGYNSDILNKYVPALVFTMYDGIYIYTSYTNTLTDVNQGNNSTYKDGENLAGLKPYIFYSCRYKTGATDVVITYSLDNHIQIDGKVNNQYIHKDGYLYNPNDIQVNGTNVTYRGVPIRQENALKEMLPDGNEYTYLKLNGVKYYKDINSDQWFSLLNGQKKPQGKFLSKYETTNDLAIKFFTEAKEFSDWFYNHSGLSDLRASDAVDEKGQPLKNLVDERSAVVYEFASNQRIFDNSGHIEDPASVFNNHRLAVIRYTIEKNLSIAIANYNNFTKGASANFQMPNLTEEEWAQIMNNMSMISFLEGLNIGGKVYNGYSIVNNNKNQEVVSENSIYIVGSDNNYHMVTDKDLVSTVTPKVGYMNTDFERKSVIGSEDTTKYYYPRRELGCYGSIVAHTNLDVESDSVYEYLGKSTNSSVASVYYTALARERYSSYKASRTYDTYTEDFKE